jgi:hypothetical protein
MRNTRQERLQCQSESGVHHVTPAGPMQYPEFRLSVVGHEEGAVALACDEIKSIRPDVSCPQLWAINANTQTGNGDMMGMGYRSGRSKQRHK